MRKPPSIAHLDHDTIMVLRMTLDAVETLPRRDRADHLKSAILSDVAARMPWMLADVERKLGAA